MSVVRRFAVVVLVAAAVLGAWAPAHAEEAEGHGGTHELMELDWKQTVPAIAVFLILLVVLSRVAWKPILNGLKAREDAIRKALDEAAEASARAKAMVAEYESKLEKARAEAHQVLEEGRRDAEALKGRIEADAQRAADETRQRAVRDIEQARDKATDQILREVAAIATETASRIIRRTLSPEGNAELVDQVVREFAAAKGGRKG
jgi:F-type H+-transporting ATPase subunit b